MFLNVKRQLSAYIWRRFIAFFGLKVQYNAIYILRIFGFLKKPLLIAGPMQT